MSIYYIYQHRRNDTGEIFYVGKGKGKRGIQTNSRNKHWKNITAVTGYTVEILFENLEESVAFLVEIGLITKYKSEGKKLCNYTIGGDGRSGVKHNVQSKKIMSQKKTGIKLSDDHKRKISEASKGKVISQEQRKKISDSLKGRKLSDDHKRKIREGINKINILV
jgi:hypothetical protein